MKETRTAEQLQRMQTRPASGTVVGTTTGVVVPREQLRGDRIPGKQGSPSTTLNRAIPTSAYGAPLGSGSTRPYPLAEREQESEREQTSYNSAERKSNFYQIRRKIYQKRRKMMRNIRQTFNISKRAIKREETQLAYPIRRQDERIAQTKTEKRTAGENIEENKNKKGLLCRSISP